MEDKKYYLKPRLGRTVYCIYHDEGILVDTVSYLGKDSFIVDSFNSCTNEDSWEWMYGTYNLDWFTSLTAAKKYLKELLEDKYRRKIKIRKVCDDWYEAEFA